MRRRVMVMLAASGAAVGALGVSPLPALAECPYLPPWPPVTTAIPTAERILVGEIVATTDLGGQVPAGAAGHRDIVLRVTLTLRGNEAAGDLVDVQYLLPNWPQARIEGEGMLPSCTYLTAAPGEVIVLALGAWQPGGRMRDGGVSWVQPPTRYNAMGVITWKGADRDGYPEWEDRERVTLEQVRRLAAMPMTDAATEGAPQVPTELPLAAAGLLGTLVAARRLRSRAPAAL